MPQDARNDASGGGNAFEPLSGFTLPPGAPINIHTGPAPAGPPPRSRLSTAIRKWLVRGVMVGALLVAGAVALAVIGFAHDGGQLWPGGGPVPTPTITA